MLTNLLANAVKYTTTRAEAHIQVFAVEQDDEIIVAIKDAACRKSGAPRAIGRE